MTKEAPWAIVVGVGYGDTRDVWWKKRARDFLPKPERSEAKGKLSLAGGSERFREFLAAELLPFIEKNYPVRSDDRTLVGYSLGGFFALDTLFAKSGLFQRYVVISPAIEWDRKRIFAMEEAYHAGHDSLPAIVFHSIGGSEKNLALWQELEQQMRARGYRDLHLVSQVFQGETHVSTVPAALGRGLKVVRLAPESDAQSAEEPPIRSQVIQAVRGMIAAEERLDSAAAWAVHADVPGYKWVDTDGTAYDFAGSRKAWADYLAGCARLKYTTLKEDVLVLAPDLALYTWTGSADVTSKDGPRTRNEQWTARYLCRRIGGTWRIIGGQESSAPGKVVDAAAVD